MTYSIPSEKNHLPINRPARQFNPIELFSLYQKDANGYWHRVSDNAYSMKLAYRVFITRLLADPENYRIRKIKISSLGANLRFGR